MVVCKFFIQGSCRYGQNCRFEHVYGSQYSYHANPSQQPQTSNATELVNQVQMDVQAALKGNQWILSCYSPIKDKPTFPGLHDLSPEEVRLFIYEAKANNNIDQAISYINSLVKDARQKYERLSQPDVTITKTLRSLYKGESVSSPFDDVKQAFPSNVASSIFRSAVQNPVRSQAPSIFNQSSQSSNPKDLFANAANQNIVAQSANVFNKPQETDAKSIFAKATQNVFQQQSQAPQNIFATANQNTPAPNTVFAAANKYFGQEDNKPSFTLIPNSNSVPQNVFKDKIDDTAYSRIEDLTPEDLNIFKSDKFELGFIPEIAPPQELCQQ